MNRRLHILALLPALLAAMMWARSYWHFDFGVAHGWTLGSESGSLYICDGRESDAYNVSGPLGAIGRLEVETGLTYQPWFSTWPSPPVRLDYAHRDPRERGTSELKEACRHGVVRALESGRRLKPHVRQDPF
jgi:hypothetical protein